jgi:hypothetical protein
MTTHFQNFIKPDNSGVFHGTWNNPEAIMSYSSYLAKILGWNNNEDWYGLTQLHLQSNYGANLLAKCGKSPYNVLKMLFPKYQWLPWKMCRQPVGLWDLNAIVEVNDNTDSNIHPGKILKNNINGTYNIEYDNGEKEDNVNKDRVKIVSRPNVRKYADWLFIKLEFDVREKWYDNNGTIINDNYGLSMLHNIYNGSYVDFVMTTYPEHDWDGWRFNRARLGFWDNLDNHTKFAVSFAKQHNYTKPEDWYKITIKEIDKHGGGGMLQTYYDNSPHKFVTGVVKSIFPEHEWVLENFNSGRLYSIPDNSGRLYYWQDNGNRITFALTLGEKLGYIEPEHWYKIKLYMIHENGGAGLVGGYYDDSPQKFVLGVVQTIYPDYVWLPWKFDFVPNNFWKEHSNQKLYADWLGKELGYVKYEDWYDITLRQIKDKGGGGLVVGYYEGTLFEFLKSVYPEHNWIPWKFKRTSGGAWKDMETQKKAILEFEQKLNFVKPEDWYDIDRQTLKNHGLLSMLSNYYNTSLSRCITELFPEYNLKRTKFRHNYSVGSIQWLNYLKVCLPDMRHILNHDAGEFIIPSTNYKADGFSKINNCIFEYHGDFWHGNPALYNPDDTNPVSNKTYGELYNNTLVKQLYCENNGFVYKFIWESEWIRGKTALIILQQRFRHRSLHA